MSEHAVALPRTRRRKPLPPAFKLAVAQVLYCHAWVTYDVVRWIHDVNPVSLAVAGLFVGLAWARPSTRHVWYDVMGCVHRCRQYWREWRDS